MVVVDACVGELVPVETDFVSGWVNRKYISMVSPALCGVTGVSAGDTLNLRAPPHLKSNRQAVAPSVRYRFPALCSGKLAEDLHPGDLELE